MELRATKRSMYELVRGYESLPVMKQVTFEKVPRRASYFLHWLGGKAYLSVCGGKAVLLVTKDGDSVTYPLSLQDLDSLGMVSRQAS